MWWPLTWGRLWKGGGGRVLSGDGGKGVVSWKMLWGSPGERMGQINGGP